MLLVTSDSNGSRPGHLRNQTATASSERKCRLSLEGHIQAWPRTPKHRKLKTSVLSMKKRSGTPKGRISPQPEPWSVKSKPLSFSKFLPVVIAARRKQSSTTKATWNARNAE